MDIRIGEKVKTKLTLSIESEIVEKAKKIGLNISQACENALRLYITAMENANQQITSNPSALTKREGMETYGFHKMAGPRGFEPRFSGSGGRRLNPCWATGPR